MVFTKLYKMVPTLSLVISSTALGVQWFVLYPTQSKIHRDICDIREHLRKNN